MSVSNAAPHLTLAEHIATGVFAALYLAAYIANCIAHFVRRGSPKAEP
jgi:hypothetical protein